MMTVTLTGHAAQASSGLPARPVATTIYCLLALVGRLLTSGCIGKTNARHPAFCVLWLRLIFFFRKCFRCCCWMLLLVAPHWAAIAPTTVIDIGAGEGVGKVGGVDRES